MIIFQTEEITTKGQTFAILSNGNREATITLDFLLVARIEDENVYITKEKDHFTSTAIAELERHIKLPTAILGTIFDL